MNGQVARTGGGHRSGNCKQALHNRSMREQCHIPGRFNRGFTLIELMVTVVVAGILAAIAIPGYQTYVMKSRREDARTTLAAMVQAQERFRATASAYSQDVSWLMTGTTGGATTSPKGYYNMSVTDLSPAVNFVSGYEIHAGATGLQAGDTQCRDMYIRMQNGTLSYRDGDMATTAISSPCWPQ